MAPRGRRVVWAYRAREALDETVGYVAAQSPQAATALLTRILDAAGSLAELGERGRIVPELDDPILRELLVDPYRLLYEVHSDHVRVVGLLHQRREFERWRRRAQ